MSAVSSVNLFRTLGCLSAMEDKAVSDARASIRGFETFFKIHNLKAKFAHPHLLEKYYADLWLSGEFIPGAKWATAYFLADLAGGPEHHRALPPRPSFVPDSLTPLGFLFPGETLVRTILRTRLGERKENGLPTARSLRLAWSFLGLKDLMPPMWVNKIINSLEDHRALLTAEPAPISGTAADLLKVLGNSIGRLVLNRYGDKSEPLIPYTSLPRAKLSASAGFVKYFDEDSRRWRTMEGTRAAQYARLGGIHTEELLHMLYHPRVGETEIRGHPYSFSWEEWDFDPRVDVVALQEPFKIRTISIADGPATAAGTPLQKAWHTTMRALKPFTLIGGTVVADALSIFPELKLGQYWVSGDYSAATDRLNMHATKAVFDGLLKTVALPSELRRRLEVALTSSELNYQDTINRFKDEIPEALYGFLKGQLPEGATQTNGQLMGNVLSFPILCLVNLGGYLLTHIRRGSPTGLMSLRAMDRGYFTHRELQSLEVLVNGDDILFQCDERFYSSWLRATQELGFKPSVGKNYISERFLTVNSQMFDSRLRPIVRPWWAAFATDFLYKAKAVVDKGESAFSADPRRVLPKVQQKLLDSIPSTSRSSANVLWMDHVRSTKILDYFEGLNWFLPVEVGGMGLQSLGHEHFVDDRQKKLGSKLLIDPKGRRFLPRVDGSLSSEQSRLALRSSKPTLMFRGEVIEEDGRKYVYEKNPIGLNFTVQGNDIAVSLVARRHEVLSSYEAASPLLSTWLDHHTDGVRFDGKKAQKCVQRMLKWACDFSKKKIVPLEELTVDLPVQVIAMRN